MILINPFLRLKLSINSILSLSLKLILNILLVIKTPGHSSLNYEASSPNATSPPPFSTYLAASVRSKAPLFDSFIHIFCLERSFNSTISLQIETMRPPPPKKKKKKKNVLSKTEHRRDPCGLLKGTLRLQIVIIYRASSGLRRLCDHGRRRNEIRKGPARSRNSTADPGSKIVRGQVDLWKPLKQCSNFHANAFGVHRP